MTIKNFKNPFHLIREREGGATNTQVDKFPSWSLFNVPESKRQVDNEEL